MFSHLYLWLWKPFQRCYTWCCTCSLGVGLRVWETGGAVLPLQLLGPSVPPWVTRVAGDHISPTHQEPWPQVLSFGKSMCPSWLCSEWDGPGLPVLRFWSQSSVCETWLLGWDLGKGTAVPCSAFSGKRETCRVVPPVHARLRASGFFIHTNSTLAFDIYVSLSWSSVGRLHLEKEFIGEMRTPAHRWVHTHLQSQTQPSLMSGEMAGPLLLCKTALYHLWMNGKLVWKQIVSLIYNGLIRQIKRAFLPVFSNQNMPPSLFAYLLSLCCPNRTHSIFAMAKVKSSSPVIRGRTLEDSENNGVILLQSSNWKCWACPRWRWIRLLS